MGKKAIILETAQELLDLIGLEGEVDLVDDQLEITIHNQEPGLLIGFHGETLDAFQHLLKKNIFKKTGQWEQLVVETARYRQNRQKDLHQLANQAALQVEETGEAVVMPVLSAYERRIIHLELVDHDKVYSSSEGEGSERRIVVYPKESEPKSKS
ncbi:protein jag [Patescibacteria group bacterium]